MTPEYGGKRPRQEDAALAALLAEPTIEAAAVRAGISKSTLLRWLAEPDFKARYRAARRALVEHAVSRLQQAAVTFAETLETIASDPAAPAAARVAASKEGLAQTFRGLEVLDLADEIATLKRQLIERGDDKAGGTAA